MAQTVLKDGILTDDQLVPVTTAKKQFIVPSSLLSKKMHYIETAYDQESSYIRIFGIHKTLIDEFAYRLNLLFLLLPERERVMQILFMCLFF